MKNVDEFRRHLRRKGKKDHVVDGLVERCQAFEGFLRSRRKAGIDDADRNDVLAFFDEIRDQKADVNNQLRAISLYYRFAQKTELSELAGGLRRQRLASPRKPFALKDFCSVNSKHIAALAKEGVMNAEQMLEAGKAPVARRRLSAATGVPVEAILELVKLSDLSRIEGVKGVRARLYVDSGVDTVEKMAKWDPEKLRSHMTEFVERTGFKGIPPLPKEVRSTIDTAKKLPKLVEY